MKIYNVDAGILKVDQNCTETIISGYPSDNDIDFTVKVTNDYVCIYKFNADVVCEQYGNEMQKTLQCIGVDYNIVRSAINNPKIKILQVWRD